jgi:hypothetical protein
MNYTQGQTAWSLFSFLPNTSQLQSLITTLICKIKLTAEEAQWRKLTLKHNFS